MCITDMVGGGRICPSTCTVQGGCNNVNWGSYGSLKGMLPESSNGVTGEIIKQTTNLKDYVLLYDLQSVGNRGEVNCWLNCMDTAKCIGYKWDTSSNMCTMYSSMVVGQSAKQATETIQWMCGNSAMVGEICSFTDLITKKKAPLTGPLGTYRFQPDPGCPAYNCEGILYNDMEIALTSAPTVAPVAADPCTVYLFNGPNTINACNQEVYIKSRSYDGIGYPRMVAYGVLYPDPEQQVRALSVKPCDFDACRWRLAKRPSGNVAILASNNDTLKVMYENGPIPRITTDPTFSNIMPDKVCQEFTLRYNVADGGYTISIPDNYPHAGTQLGLEPGQQADGDPDDPGGVVMVLAIENPASPNLWIFEPVETSAAPTFAPSMPPTKAPTAATTTQLVSLVRGSSVPPFQEKSTDIRQWPYPQLINGGLRFSGIGASTGNWLAFPTNTIDMKEGFTFVVAFRFARSAAWQRVFDFGNGPGDKNILLTQKEDQAVLRFGVYDSAGTESVCEVPIEFGKVLVAWGWYDPTLPGMTLRVDNAGVVSTGRLYAPKMLDKRTLTRNYVGKSNWDGDSYSNMDLFHLQMFNEFINEGPRQTQLIQYAKDEGAALSVLMGLPPTSSPTSSPTKAPTSSPTKAPTSPPLIPSSVVNGVDVTKELYLVSYLNYNKLNYNAAAGNLNVSIPYSATLPPITTQFKFVPILGTSDEYNLINVSSGSRVYIDTLTGTINVWGDNSPPSENVIDRFKFTTFTVGNLTFVSIKTSMSVCMADYCLNNTDEYLLVNDRNSAIFVNKNAVGVCTTPSTPEQWAFPCAISSWYIEPVPAPLALSCDLYGISLCKPEGIVLGAIVDGQIKGVYASGFLSSIGASAIFADGNTNEQIFYFEPSDIDGWFYMYTKNVGFFATQKTRVYLRYDAVYNHLKVSNDDYLTQLYYFRAVPYGKMDGTFGIETRAGRDCVFYCSNKYLRRFTGSPLTNIVDGTTNKDEMLLFRIL